MRLYLFDGVKRQAAIDQHARRRQSLQRHEKLHSKLARRQHQEARQGWHHAERSRAALRRRTSTCIRLLRAPPPGSPASETAPAVTDGDEDTESAAAVLHLQEPREEKHCGVKRHVCIAMRLHKGFRHRSATILDQMSVVRTASSKYILDPQAKPLARALDRAKGSRTLEVVRTR